jgi:hypothetical protein
MHAVCVCVFSQFFVFCFCFRGSGRTRSLFFSSFSSFSPSQTPHQSIAYLFFVAHPNPSPNPNCSRSRGTFHSSLKAFSAATLPSTPITLFAFGDGDGDGSFPFLVLWVLCYCSIERKNSRLRCGVVFFLSITLTRTWALRLWVPG